MSEQHHEPVGTWWRVGRNGISPNSEANAQPPWDNTTFIWSARPRNAGQVDISFGMPGLGYSILARKLCLAVAIVNNGAKIPRNLAYRATSSHAKWKYICLSCNKNGTKLMLFTSDLGRNSEDPTGIGVKLRKFTSKPEHISSDNPVFVVKFQCSCDLADSEVVLICCQLLNLVCVF